MDETRQGIIRDLMHTSGMGFNELWNKRGDSSRFAYHLRVVEEDGLVCKQDGKYFLTHVGKKQAAYLEGESGKRSEAPLVIVVIVVRDGDRYLMCERTKEPFYGYWGFHGGKLKKDQYILECAAAELKEEAGLECDLELKGLFSSKTYNNGELSYNHQIFMVRGENPRGELLSETREGRNRWVHKSEIKDLSTFPNVFKSLEIVKSDRFLWVEVDREQKDDQFVGMKVLREKKF